MKVLSPLIPSICPSCVGEFAAKMAEADAHPGVGTVGMFCEHRLARVHAIVDHGVIQKIAVHGCPTLEQACDEAHAAAVALQTTLTEAAELQRQRPPGATH